jgi:iron complex outermembrane receptor protein
MAINPATAGSAWAQSESAPAAAAPSEGLGEIIVTAQRRSENLQRAAIAVDVVTADNLRAAGVVTSTTLNAAVPSLSVQQGGGANLVYFIRGVGNFTLNGYSDPAIAFNVDGVYLGRPTATTGTFYDLERIEVLKGPQGTLYGRNATGGAINVIPARPVLGKTAGSLAFGYGNYNAVDVEAALNVPLGQTAAFRIAGKVVKRDGYNADGTLDEVGHGLRAQLLLAPSSDFKVRFAVDYSHQGGVGPGGSYLGHEVFTGGAPASSAAPANFVFVPSGLDAFSGFHSADAKAYYAQRFIPQPRINPAPLAYPYLNNTYWGALAEVTWNTGIGDLTILPAYRKSKLDLLFNGPSFRSGRNDETDRQFSLEARLAGKRIGPVDWLIGGYYFHETVNGRYAFNQYGSLSFQAFRSTTESLAAFGRLTAHLTDSFRLVAGGRYTRDNKDIDANVTVLSEGCTLATCVGGPSLPPVLTLAEVAGAPTTPFTPVAYGTFGNTLTAFPLAFTRAVNRGRFTYRLAAEYDLGPSSLLYASYETGYRSGGFALAFGREQFGPEYVEALTIGSKNRFFGNRVQLNVEAFRWKYRDQQVSHLGLDGRGAPGFFTENVGRSTVQGVDIETQVLVTPTTKFDATVQYLDTVADDFVYDSPRTSPVPPPTTCGVTPTTDSANRPVFRVDCSGRPTFNSPRWSVNAGVEQTIPLGEHKIVLAGNLRYRSNAYIGFEYLPQMQTGSNTLFDASIAFGDSDDRWTISGFIRNITDRQVRSYVQYGAATGGTLSAIYAPPRTYGFRLAYRFN